MLPIPFANAALLVVDMQQGFTTLCPHELPIPGALEIVPAVNAAIALPWQRIDATLDWHPADHCSFHVRGGPYPPHCVAGTPGAIPIPGLDADRFHTLWRKGFQRDFEAYAVTAQHPAMPQFYRAAGIETVAVCGLATNICCFFAARDFRSAGFRVILVENASAGIDIPAANLFQAAAKQQGLGLGIEYRNVESL